MAELEGLLRFLLNLFDVVETFDPVPALESLFYIENVAYQFVILLGRFNPQTWDRFLDRAESFHHQHGMMRYDRAAAFVHDRRMRNVFGIAHVHDVPNDVVSVLLK